MAPSVCGALHIASDMSAHMILKLIVILFYEKVAKIVQLEYVNIEVQVADFLQTQFKKTINW